jgi:hypothetical protein
MFGFRKYCKVLNKIWYWHFGYTLHKTEIELYISSLKTVNRVINGKSYLSNVGLIKHKTVVYI